MKFDTQKFLEFEMGPYEDIEACVKCAAVYALGSKVDHNVEEELYYYNLSDLSVEGNWFRVNISDEFADDMNEAESMLRDRKEPEAIKKFVIDAAIKAGLVEGVTDACKEEIKTCT